MWTLFRREIKRMTDGPIAQISAFRIPTIQVYG